MISSLIVLLLLWATGTIVLALYTIDDEQPTRTKKAQGKSLGKPPMDNGYTGLGGEISRLEAKFEGQELELHRAAYLADHPHHRKVIRARDGALSFDRRIIKGKGD